MTDKENHRRVRVKSWTRDFLNEASPRAHPGYLVSEPRDMHLEPKFVRTLEDGRIARHYVIGYAEPTANPNEFLVSTDNTSDQFLICLDRTMLFKKPRRPRPAKPRAKNGQDANR